MNWHFFHFQQTKGCAWRKRTNHCSSFCDFSAIIFLHDISRSCRLLRGPGSSVALLNVSRRCQLTAEAPQEGAVMEQKLPSDFNHTARHISTPSPAAGSGALYALVPFVLLTLLGCAVAVVRGTVFAALHGFLLLNSVSKRPCFSFRYCTSGGGRGKFLFWDTDSPAGLFGCLYGCILKWFLAQVRWASPQADSSVYLWPDRGTWVGEWRGWQWGWGAECECKKQGTNANRGTFRCEWINIWN